MGADYTPLWLRSKESRLGILFARFDPVEDEGIALGLGDADIGLGVKLEVDHAAVAQLNFDHLMGAFPAALFLEERVIDDDQSSYSEKLIVSSSSYHDRRA